jgi:opacity protein-like surface antigen
MIAGAATIALGTTAQAADVPLMPPPQPMIAESSGWYLRGDVGVGMQSYKNFGHRQTNPDFTWPASWTIEQRDIKDPAFVAFGIGYAYNSWLRFDATGEYRASTKFKAIGSYTEYCPGGGKCFDVYDGDHQASVFLANAYIDLGTWWCLTPFVGAGVGMAYHRFDGFSDIGIVGNQSPGFGYMSGSSSKWTLAWQVSAGVAYDVTRNVKLEFAVRYLDLGSPSTGIINCNSSGCQTNGPRAYYTLNNLNSLDFKLGMRWMLDAPEPYEPPPLVRKG